MKIIVTGILLGLLAALALAACGNPLSEEARLENPQAWEEALDEAVEARTLDWQEENAHLLEDVASLRMDVGRIEQWSEGERDRWRATMSALSDACNSFKYSFDEDVGTSVQDRIDTPPECDSSYVDENVRLHCERNYAFYEERYNRIINFVPRPGTTYQEFEDHLKDRAHSEASTRWGLCSAWIPVEIWKFPPAPAPEFCDWLSRDYLDDDIHTPSRVVRDRCEEGR